MCRSELCVAGLACLDLSENNIRGPGLEQVSNRLKETGSLRCIRLCDNAIDEGIEYLVPVLHNLTELDLSYNQVSAAGISVLADHLRSSSCKIQALKLKGNCMGDEGALLFAEAVENNSTLTHLDLSNNAIEAAGVAAVLKAAASGSIQRLCLDDSRPDLSTCVQDIAGSRVREISLRCAGLDDESACRLAQALVLGFGKCLHLDLRDNKACLSRGRTALEGVTKVKKGFLLRL